MVWFCFVFILNRSRIDKCGVLVTVPISSSELLATLPLTGRRNTRDVVRTPSLSLPILTTEATTQHSSSLDSSLSANQPLLAPLSFSSPACPLLPKQGFQPGLWSSYDWEQAPAMVTTRTCPVSLGLQDSRHQSSQSLLATKEEMRSTVNCSCAKKPWVRAKDFQSQAPYCVWEEVAKATRVLTPQDCSPGGTTLKGDGGPPLPSL